MTIIDEVNRHSETLENEPRSCRCCGKVWTPNTWNFYDFCDTCFQEFDEQKMRGRFALLGGEAIPYFESSDEWLDARKKNE